MQHLNNNMSVINKTMYNIYSVPIELNNKPETSFIFILLENQTFLIKKIKKHTHTDP